MGGGGSASPAPQFNAQQSAADQTTSNINTAVANKALNNTNQVTPYGSLTYDQTGTTSVGGNSVPTYTATQTFSPTEQQLFDKTTGLQSGALDIAKTGEGQVSNALASPYDLSGTHPLTGDQQDFKNQAYDSLMGRFNTDFAHTQAATDTSLRNQGLQPGSEAYNTQMDVLNRTKTDAQQQAEINATTLAGQNISQGQAIHSSQVGDYNATRDQPINEYSALFGLGNGVTQPNYVNTPQSSVAPTDVAGMNLAAYQGQLASYNQQLASNNATMGGLFGLGGSVLGGLARAPGVQGFLGLA